MILRSLRINALVVLRRRFVPFARSPPSIRPFSSLILLIYSSRYRLPFVCAAALDPPHPLNTFTVCCCAARSRLVDPSSFSFWIRRALLLLDRSLALFTTTRAWIDRYGRPLPRSDKAANAYASFDRYREVRRSCLFIGGVTSTCVDGSDGQTLTTLPRRVAC